MSTARKKPAHLEPSKLGTKEYWDELYAAEISNHAHDPSDTGTVWFDDADAEAKMIEFLSSSCSCSSSSPASSLLDNSSGPDSAPSFLDLGTGNGSLLFGLRDEGGFGGGSRMLGVDYSARSVEFARRIERDRRRRRRRGRQGREENNNNNDVNRAAGETPPGKPEEEEEEEEEEKQQDDREPEVEFLEHDILGVASASAAALLTGAQRRGWDAVLDKGTFDAVSLSAAAGPDAGRRYRAAVLPLVRAGGVFLVTSCNWTEDELRAWFEDEDEDDDSKGKEGEEGEEGEGEGRWGFEVVDRIQYPSFSFGGVKGQAISTLCFRKVKKS